MSATLIYGGPAGPDEVGDPYRNRVETDRAVLWEAAGALQGVRRGFVASVVPGQMAVSYSAGFAVVEERTALGARETGRGYAVWSDEAELASFGPASASTRVDSVVLAFVDVAVGAAALGTETATVGGQIVVVPGVSGVTTPRTIAEINAAVGSGGWVKLHDVTIPAGSTQILAGNMEALAAEETNLGDIEVDSITLTEGRLDRIAHGNTFGNTNSSGDMTVTHGLGTTPATIIAASGDAGRHCAVTSWNSTTFTIAVTKATGASHTSSPFTVRWWAVK